MKRIHIVGTGPRTGTTLLAEAINACFRIDRYLKHEERITGVRPAPGRISLSKNPNDILIVRPLLLADPHLYVLCMIRDPRDAITSKHGKHPDVYYAGLRYWKAYLPFWRRARRHPRFLTIRYEDLVANPDSVQQVLIDRMGFLEMRAAFSRYHEIAAPSNAADRALRGVRPITRSSVGAWRDHLTRIATQVQLHGSIAMDLIEVGYEDDESWLTLLDGVEPCTLLSHWPEFFSVEEIDERRRGVGKEFVKIFLRRCGITRW